LLDVRNGKVDGGVLRKYAAYYGTAVAGEIAGAGQRSCAKIVIDCAVAMDGF